MIRYVFKEQPFNLLNNKDADPQKIGEAVARIKQQTTGRCNSKTILEAARNKANYLHRFIEWNNALAAEKYRLDQIRELVRCIDVVDDDVQEGKPMPAFISLIERAGRGYHTAREVIDSVDLQNAALRQAEADLSAYERRLEQFKDICDAIRVARELIAARRAKSEKSANRRKQREDRPTA